MGIVGPILYALLFVVVLPVALLGWGWATSDIVQLPVPPYPATGFILALTGGAVMLAGMAALRTHGGGLPMNAYPPPRLVVRSVYRWLNHPIYVGFTIICAGTSIWLGSSSGLWLVTPAVAAGSGALVLGYEQHDLRRRFGPQTTKPLLSLASASKDRPTLAVRLATIFLVFGPWLLVYELTILIGVPAGAFEVYLPFERTWPVLQWTEMIYASAYIVVPLTVFAVSTNAALRRFSVYGLIATASTGLCFWTLPAIAPPRPFEVTTFWGKLLEFERSVEFHSGAAALPSFHVIWSCLAAHFLAERYRRWGLVAWLWAAMVAVSCVTTGMHALVDIIGGVAFYCAAVRSGAAWSWIRAATERVANSWREWRVGPVRIINHGAYGGLGAFLGVAIAGVLIGPEYLGSLWIIGVTAMVTAGFWAQIIEGESVSLRPFGYYGSVIGAAIGGGFVWATGGELLPCLAALAVAAPWVQSCGRLRCLVQGCCHGYETTTLLGVHFRHPRSRVVRLSTLGGRPIHPTQTYSILFNIVCGVVLLRLWSLELPLTFLIGMYLILAGIGRFVEESFRGEPQTPVVKGLAIYQWNAIISLLLGLALTCVDSQAANYPLTSPLQGSVLGAAIGFGLFIWLIMGVDFPNSTRRFARLTK